MLDGAVLAHEHSGEAPGLDAVSLPRPGGVLGVYRFAVERPRFSLEEVAAQQVALGEAVVRSFEQARLADVAGVFGG